MIKDNDEQKDIIKDYTKKSDEDKIDKTDNRTDKTDNRTDKTDNKTDKTDGADDKTNPKDPQDDTVEIEGNKYDRRRKENDIDEDEYHLRNKERERSKAKKKIGRYTKSPNWVFVLYILVMSVFLARINRPVETQKPKIEKNIGGETLALDYNKLKDRDLEDLKGDRVQLIAKIKDVLPQSDEIHLTYDGTNTDLIVKVGIASPRISNKSTLATSPKVSLGNYIEMDVEYLRTEERGPIFKSIKTNNIINDEKTIKNMDKEYKELVEEYEKDFKFYAEKITPDELYRKLYEIEGNRIKIPVKIETIVEEGHKYIATYEDKNIILNYIRKQEEPRLIEGDNLLIYGRPRRVEDISQLDPNLKGQAVVIDGEFYQLIEEEIEKEND